MNGHNAIRVRREGRHKDATGQIIDQAQGSDGIIGDADGFATLKGIVAPKARQEGARASSVRAPQVVVIVGAPNACYVGDRVRSSHAVIGRSGGDRLAPCQAGDDVKARIHR